MCRKLFISSQCHLTCKNVIYLYVTEPVFTIKPLDQSVVIFVKWRKEYLQSHKAVFKITCNNKGCGACIVPEKFQLNYNCTPVASYIAGLKENHNYKLVSKVADFEGIHKFTTKGEVLLL